MESRDGESVFRGCIVFVVGGGGDGAVAFLAVLLRLCDTLFVVYWLIQFLCVREFSLCVSLPLLSQPAAACLYFRTKYSVYNSIWQPKHKSIYLLTRFLMLCFLNATLGRSQEERRTSKTRKRIQTEDDKINEMKFIYSPKKAQPASRDNQMNLCIHTYVCM